nr:NADH dehydrogenase subunit 2 [Glomeridesmus spelaeus]QCF39642.1 NADH dehydrogenase subunit 2 [Glomeridesmus spelaeus]
MFQLKPLFFVIMIIGTLISISSTSWFSIWMGLEINMIAFISMLFKNSKSSAEIIMKLFLIQAVASLTILFFSIFSSMFNLTISNIIMNKYYMIMIPLLLKMASAPLHFWMPALANGLSWLYLFILISWQKLAPLFLMFNFMFMDLFIIIIMMNLIIGSVMGINQTSMKKIIIFSSINHMGWMLSSILISETMFIFYFIIYMISIIPIIMMFYKSNIPSLNNLLFNKSKSIMFMLMFSFNILSMAGMPPFVGFIMKIIIFNQLKMTMLISITMILTSLISLFFYTRLIYTSSSILISMSKIKYTSKEMYNSIIFSIFPSILIPMIII